jgi:hypothetical protein
MLVAATNKLYKTGKDGAAAKIFNGALTGFIFYIRII